jgi:hypothetical protein
MGAHVTHPCHFRGRVRAASASLLLPHFNLLPDQHFFLRILQQTARPPCTGLSRGAGCECAAGGPPPASTRQLWQPSPASWARRPDAPTLHGQGEARSGALAQAGSMRGPTAVIIAAFCNSTVCGASCRVRAHLQHSPPSARAPSARARVTPATSLAQPAQPLCCLQRHVFASSSSSSSFRSSPTPLPPCCFCCCLLAAVTGTAGDLVSTRQPDDGSTSHRDSKTLRLPVCKTAIQPVSQTTSHPGSHHPSSHSHEGTSPTTQAQQHSLPTPQVEQPDILTTTLVDI